MKSLCRKPYSFWVLLSLALIWSLPCSADSSPEFDSQFRYSTERFLIPHYGADWRLLKAQGIAESRLDPKAVSPVGAMGVMQFMPATWAQVSQQLGLNASPYDPTANIIAGGFYMRRLLDQFKSPRPPEDRRRWAWSAYNWGIGNVLKAQNKASGATDWWYIRPYLPQETIVYVYSIEKER